MTAYTEFHVSLFICVDKPNIRPDIRPEIRPNIRSDIRIKFLLSLVFHNGIIYTCIKFHANLFNIEEVKKPDIRPDIRIITKI